MIASPGFTSFTSEPGQDVLDVGRRQARLEDLQHLPLGGDRFTASRAGGTWLISFSAAMRGISTQIVGSAARMVAPRLRPEIRPTSPKISLAGMVTVMFGLEGSTSTFTEPFGDAEHEEPSRCG
jgi:hypothetical protein